jgi:hypothetical protein
MGISYLSAPIKPGVIPEQIPIELVSQVATQKQNKYDQALESIFAQYTNLLNLDTSSNSEITQKYYGMMKEADKNLTSLAKLDFLNPENAQKVEGIFNPILQDEDILNAVAKSKQNQEVNSTFQGWLKKGSDDYSELNYRDALEQQRVNRNMSAKEFSQKPREVTATPYKDVDKYLIEQAKQIPEFKDIAIAPSGAFVINSGKTEVSKDRILKMLNISGPYLSQMKINARQEYKNTPPEAILSSMIDRTKDDIKSYERINSENVESNKITDINIAKLEKENPDSPLSAEMLKVFRVELGPELPATTTNQDVLKYLRDSKKTRENNISENKESINTLETYSKDLLTSYQGSIDVNGKVILTKPLEFEKEDFLKTQFAVRATKEKIAEGMAYKNISIELTIDPEYMAKLNHNLEVEKIALQTKMDILKTNQTKGTNSSGNGSTKDPDQVTENVNGIKTDGEKIDNFTYEEKQLAIINDIEKVPITFAEELFLADPKYGTNFGSLDDTQKAEFVKKASDKINDVARVYDQLGKDIIQTGWGKNAQAIVTSDFVKENKRAIQYYETQQNLINSQKLMKNIKQNIDKAVPLKASKEFVDFLSTQPYFILDMKTFEDNLMDIKNLGLDYKILLPPDMQENMKKQGINGFNLKKVYDYNISKGNNPRIGSLNIAGGRPIMSEKVATYEEFENIVMNRDINTNNTQWSDFDPLNSIYGDRNDQLKLQSTILIVPSFNAIPNTETFKQLSSTVVKGVRDLYQAEVDPSKISNIEIYKDPKKGFNMNVSMLKEDGQKEAVTYMGLPIAPSIMQNVKGLEAMVTISEIQKGVDIMLADANARQNPNYIFKDIKKTLPESTFYYGGKKFMASINPDKYPLVVTIKNGTTTEDIAPERVSDYFFKKLGWDSPEETDLSQQINNLTINSMVNPNSHR